MPIETLPSAPAATFGTPVELTAIARELKKLWQADQTRTRASLINFAIICEGEAAMRDSTELLERFVRNHSFHALLIGAGVDQRQLLPSKGRREACVLRASHHLRAGKSA